VSIQRRVSIVSFIAMKSHAAMMGHARLAVVLGARSITVVAQAESRGGLAPCDGLVGQYRGLESVI